MRAIILAASAAVAVTVSACATSAEPAPSGAVSDAGDDCAVIAAVMTQHYRFNTTDNRPPPLWLDGRGTDWAPTCDWSRYGLTFARTFDPAAPRREGERVQWVSFTRPVYDSGGAVVETGILHGPLAGMGHECRVLSGFAGWTLGECTPTWIS